MTEDGEQAPDVQKYDPATVAWNLYRQTLEGRDYYDRLEPIAWMIVESIFTAGYRAGDADGAARENARRDG